MKLYEYNKATMKHEKIRLFPFIAIALSLMFSTFLITYVVIDKEPDIKVINEKPPIITITPDTKFSKDNLMKYLKKLRVKYPHIVLAQAELESGAFTSKIFKENHNLFGMKQAYQRATTALGTENNHAYYYNWEESVLDYALYSNKYLSRIDTEEKYLEYLGQNYAQDKHYIKKLKKIIKRNAK